MTVITNSRSGYHLRDARQEADQPYHKTGDYRILSVPYTQSLQGVHNSKVSVKGQKSQEEDRAVKAQIVDTEHYLAHNIAKDPVGELNVDSYEGKGAHEDYGRQHQVQQEDVADIGQLLKPKKWSFKQLLKAFKQCFFMLY